MKRNLLIIIMASLMLFASTVCHSRAILTEQNTSKAYELKISSVNLTCQPDDLSQQVLTLVFDRSKPKPASDNTKEQKSHISIFEEAENPNSHYLLRIKDGDRVKLSSLPEYGNRINLTDLTPKYGNRNGSIRFVTNIANAKLNFQDGDPGYRLISSIKKLNAKGKVTPNVLFTVVSIDNSCKKPSRSLAVVQGKKKKTKAERKAERKAKGDSDIYSLVNQPVKVVKKKADADVTLDFSFQDVAGDNNRYFNVDLSASPITINRIGFSGTYQISPLVFELKYNDDPKNEKNVVNIGSKLKYLYLRQDDGDQLYARDLEYRRRYVDIIGISAEIFPKIQTETDLGDISFVGDSKIGLPTNLIQTKSSLVRFEPFAGFEAGAKLRREDDSLDKDRWILRPKFGGKLYFVPYRYKNETPLTVEIEYTRRLFLKRESFFKSEQGKVVFDEFNKSPKDHVKAKISFKLNEFFTPFIEYEYGREPPKYVEVKGKFKAGFGFNFDLKLDN